MARTVTVTPLFSAVRVRVHTVRQLLQTSDWDTKDAKNIEYLSNDGSMAIKVQPYPEISDRDIDNMKT